MSRNVDEKKALRLIGCRSDYDIGLRRIDIDGFPGLTTIDAEALKAGSPDTDTKAKRFELIESIGKGKHVELSVTAATWRQRKAPNRRYLRLGEDKLASRAGSWKNQPFLEDHTTWRMDASHGTILSSKLVQESEHIVAFEQVLHVVTPAAVVGFLNGTWCKFSIGWWPVGPVMCTAHDVDIRSKDSCWCYPGEQVEVAGKLKTVEYLFPDFEGKETSTVILPAVKDVEINEMVAALAAELDIPNLLTRRRPLPKETKKMPFKNLIRVLGLSLTELTETDEGAAVAAVEALRSRATNAEARATTAETELGQAKTALSAATGAARDIQVNAVLRRYGYEAGKLGYTRNDPADPKRPTPDLAETWLRPIAAAAPVSIPGTLNEPARTVTGLDMLKSQLERMPVVIPVAQRPQAELHDAPSPTGGVNPAPVSVSVSDNPYLASVAEQLGLKVDDMVKFADGHVRVEA